MKVLVVFLFVTAALAAPQDVEVEDQAELVPRRTVPGSEDSEGGDGFVFVVPGWNPFRNFFRNIFSRGPGVTQSEDGVPGAVDVPASGVAFDSIPNGPRGRGGFFSFIDTLFRNMYSPPENATVTFKNSSIEVVSIGGVPMQVNRTIVEYTDADGSVYRRVDQRIVGPYLNSTITTTTVPTTEDEANELEFEPSTTLKHTLKKRWIFSWLKDALRKRNTPSGTTYNHLPGSDHLGKEEKEERAPDNTHNIVPIRNEDDIAVNYLGARPPHNPDAEVFDADLMRETERRFLESRGNSVVSQPMMSQPIRYQPVMSQPLRSQPLRPQPAMSQPLRSQPVMSHPVRSQPMMSQPLRTRFVGL